MYIVLTYVHEPCTDVKCSHVLLHIELFIYVYVLNKYVKKKPTLLYCVVFFLTYVAVVIKKFNILRIYVWRALLIERV